MNISIAESLLANEFHLSKILLGWIFSVLLSRTESNQVLEIDTGDSAEQQQQGQDAQAQQAPQQEAPAQPPPTIQLGQSTDEVTALLGAPSKVVNLGLKQVYVYKDLKVTFIKGKVVDVQ